MAEIAEADPSPVDERAPEASRRPLGAPVGMSVPRTRAKRLLQGRGRYTDDRGVPGVLHAAFVRSPYPAARIRHIDGAVARGMAGVVLVATGGDIAARCKPYAGIHQLFAGMRSPEQWPLVIDRALWQGEPVVAVVADTRAQAEDAADRVTIDWEPLPPVTDVEAAVAPDAPLVHPAMETNVAYEARVSHGTQGVRGPDDVTVAATFRFGRHTGVPLETRTIIAEFDPATPALLVTQSHQCPAQQQVLYARLLDLPDHAVRVVCPDVGGAYGIKQQLYGDELAVCVLSMMLKRPVKFVADRMESLVSDIHAREHVVHASLTLDREGRIRAMAVDDLFAIGAYSQYPRSSVGEGNHVLRLTGAPYDLDAFEGRMRMVLQTKPLVGHYRAVGHPVAVAVTEVLLEEAARRAKLDAATVRLRSYIAPDAYPHASHGGFAFEHLSLQACHARIVARMNLDALRAEQRRRGSARVRLGVGLAAFVELTGTGPG